MANKVTTQGRGSQGLIADGNDVVCIVKRFCSDSVACQAPVLVLPNAFLSRLPGRLPATPVPDVIWKRARRMMWLDLAEAFLQMNPEATPKVTRTVNYLLRVRQGQRPPVNFQALPWHELEMQEDHAQISDLDAGSLKLVLPMATFKARLVRR